MGKQAQGKGEVSTRVIGILGKTKVRARVVREVGKGGIGEKRRRRSG